ncbi:MAG TPA: hypothetical protein VIV82_00310 [Verrucomicrobiae bacterium]
MKPIIQFLGISACLIFLSAQSEAQSQWTVHEWGTFTSLQNEAGEAIGGINTDDEPVPDFVHRLAHLLLLPPTEVPTIYFQGAPKCHPDVTMRLETPVLYFHPPANYSGIQTANVRVQFRGGWLTEFYPDAIANAPGLTNGWFNFGPLKSDTVSELKWNDLKVGGDWPVTNTSAHVWTSPRAVQSALVKTPNDESEKFLFYRGVAHIDAPLRISRSGEELLFHSQLENLPVNRALTLRSVWLVDIQPDEKLAFRALPSLTLDGDSTKILARTSASFETKDYHSGNLKELRSALKKALIAEGLFSDEADALLNTWELSYFKSAGLRVFFTVPREWTDFYLPLEISPAATIERVMVGRIELVTPDQRSILQTLGECAPPQIQSDAVQMRTDFYAEVPRSAQSPKAAKFSKVDAGTLPLSSVISIPKTYEAYLKLGRFRNALLLDAARQNTALTNFITAYALAGHDPQKRAIHATK